MKKVCMLRTFLLWGLFLLRIYGCEQVQDVILSK